MHHAQARAQSRTALARPARWLAWVLMLAAGLLPLAARAALPLEAWGRLPAIEHVALSPSGEQLAYVRQVDADRLVVVIGLQDMKVRSTLRVGQAKVRALRWASESHLLIQASVTMQLAEFRGDQHEWSMLQVYNLKDRRLYNPLDTNQFKGLDTLNVVAGPVVVRQVAGRPVLWVQGLYTERHAKPMLVRIDLDSERVTVLRRGTPETLGWVVGPDGTVLAEHEYDERNQRWAIKLNRGDQGYVEVASGQATIDPPQPTGLGPSADTLLVHTQAAGDSRWQLLSVKDGKLSAPVADYQHFSAPVQDPGTGLLIGGIERLNGGVRHRFFDAGLQQRWNTLLEDYADANVHLVSATPGLGQVLVLVDGPAAGHKYLWHDLLAGEAQAIGDSHTGVKQTAPVRLLTYAAGDGLAIPAFLTLPVGKPAKALPLVVLPHGGPQVADTGDFDWWSQALADQGYAVLRPNFRGSSLGGDFVARGHGQWGRKMQTDLSDGVKHLVQQGLVDPARVCIVGASYGGYAAMQGGVRQGEVYRCAVAVAGVSDLGRMLDWVDRQSPTVETSTLRYWRRFMGVARNDDPALDDLSPARRVNHNTAPILLIHGNNDTVVPFEQSQLLADALRRGRRPVTLLALQGEDHWLSRSDTRLQMLRATVDFLRQHNPP